MYIIYLHQNKINKKVYIGLTGQSVEKRWFKKADSYSSNKFFYSAILKYGWDNFEHTILFENLTKEEAAAKEIELIAQYKAQNKFFGYNIQKGGNTGFKGLTHSLKARALISKKVKDSYTFEKRKMASEITKNLFQKIEYREQHSQGLISAHKKEKNNYNKMYTVERSHKISESSKGRKISEETKEKIRAARMNRIEKPFTEERKKNLSEAMKKSYLERKIKLEA